VIVATVASRCRRYIAAYRALKSFPLIVATVATKEGLTRDLPAVATLLPLSCFDLLSGNSGNEYHRQPPRRPSAYVCTPSAAHGRAETINRPPGRAPGSPSTARGLPPAMGSTSRPWGTNLAPLRRFWRANPPLLKNATEHSAPPRGCRDRRVWAIKTPLPPAVMTAGAESIRKLLRIARDLGDLQHPLAGWLSAALSEFISGAEHGRTLESAFGIVHGWWRIERVQRRDELLREIRRVCFPSHSVRGAATKITAALDRYQTRAWRVDRALMRPVQDDPLRLRLHALLKLKVPCGRSTIRCALVANEGRAPLATESGTLPPEDSATEDDPNHAASRDEIDTPT
jgi:hypothetical protein